MDHITHKSQARPILLRFAPSWLLVPTTGGACPTAARDPGDKFSISQAEPSLYKVD